MKYWLMKSEPETFSLEDLKNRPGQRESWDGVRNYQARNFMRDEMRKGDAVLFYHSNCKVPGVVGLASIASEEAYPDPSQFNKKSPYYDPKATKDNPRWMLVDVSFVKEFDKVVSLQQIKDDPQLEGILVAKRGMRLSIQPVEARHYKHICKLAKALS